MNEDTKVEKVTVNNGHDGILCFSVSLIQLSQDGPFNCNILSGSNTAAVILFGILGSYLFFIFGKIFYENLENKF